MVPDIGHITADHSPVTVYTMAEAADLEGTPHVLLPVTTAVHAAFQLMNASITPHAMTPTGKVAPHTILAISPACATQAIPWTRTSLTPAAPTMLHKSLSPGKSSNTQDPQPSIDLTAPKLSPFSILLQTLHQNQTVTLIL